MMAIKYIKINLSPCSEKFQISNRNGWSKRWFYPIIGLIALAWFLIRVIPKPSRATYPCQRIAFPLASGLIVYLIGAAGWLLGFRKAKEYLRRSSGVLAGLCIFFALISLTLPFVLHFNQISAHVPPVINNPIGEAKGINPGRVVWVHDPEATSWDGINGYWWEDAHTNQVKVDNMMSQSLQWLTGADTDASAWDALFKHFNKTHGKGEIGYRTGEKIVIKINLNNKSRHDEQENNIDASPQMVSALLRQLVNQAGINQSLISVYDASRIIPDNIYYRCTAEFPNVQFVDKWGGEGRLLRQMIGNSIQFSDGELNAQALPSIVLEADYLINMAILKRHDGQAAVTLCAKNHYGSIASPSSLHLKTRSWNFDFDTYDPQVDLMGHKDLGSKTLLYFIDGLYGGENWGAVPTRWQMRPFYDDWPSSIFVSQDGVAIDSVGYDFIGAEWSLKNNGDRYLHEAALANNPPSGTFYDPENDGTNLSSLGVHEHWNNADDKQYSRNIGSGEGIELISSELVMPMPDIKANGSDGPITITTADTLSVEIELDPGMLSGQPGEWWLYLFSSYGNFPIFDFEAPLINLQKTTLFDTHLPPGWYIFLFNVEDIPDGSFQSGWYDYVVVVVLPSGEPHGEALPDIDALVQEKIREYTGK